MEIEFTHCRNKFKKLKRYVALDLSSKKRPRLAEYVTLRQHFYGLIYFEHTTYFVADDQVSAVSEIEFRLDEGVLFNKVTYRTERQSNTFRYFSFWNDIHANPMDPDGNDLFKGVLRAWRLTRDPSV
jgi:hypothetical protein